MSHEYTIIHTGASARAEYGNAIEVVQATEFNSCLCMDGSFKLLERTQARVVWDGGHLHTEPWSDWTPRAIDLNEFLMNFDFEGSARRESPRPFIEMSDMVGQFQSIAALDGHARVRRIHHKGMGLYFALEAML